MATNIKTDHEKKQKSMKLKLRPVRKNGQRRDKEKECRERKRLEEGTGSSEEEEVAKREGERRQK